MIDRYYVVPNIVLLVTINRASHECVTPLYTQWPSLTWTCALRLGNTTFVFGARSLVLGGHVATLGENFTHPKTGITHWKR